MIIKPKGGMFRGMFRHMGLSSADKVVSAGGFTVDLWETFEFDTLTVANLDANDNCATGTWAITDASSKLDMNAVAEYATISNFNSTADPDGYGMRYNNSGGQNAYLQYTFGTAPDANPISVGFWVYVPTGLPDYTTTLILYFYTTGEASYLLRVGIYREASTYIMAWTPSTGPTLPATNAWYWVTLYVKKNATSYMRVYNSSGSLVGTEVNGTAGNFDLKFIQFGRRVGGDTAVYLYYDDLVMDWTDATFPLGP